MSFRAQMWFRAQMPRPDPHLTVLLHDAL